MTDHGVFTVREIPSPRWEIAIDLLEQWRGYVLLERAVAVTLRRWLAGPHPDPRLNVSIYASSEPTRSSPTVALVEVKLGLGAYRSALTASSLAYAVPEAPRMMQGDTKTLARGRPSKPSSGNGRF
jgi:hypothetical protein